MRLPFLRENGASLESIGRAMQPIDHVEACVAPLEPLLSQAQFVLLGEATHGTHEFYAARAAITRALVEQYGFTAVAVEADWPDAYRVNRYVRGQGEDPNPLEALGNFRRFPRWMWRNTDIVDFVSWLHAFNRQRTFADQVGFYGMDLYSLHSSMAAVIEYLESVDPQAAARARQRYGCFGRFDNEPQAYGYRAGLGLSRGCEDEVVSQLDDLRQRSMDYLRQDGLVAEDEVFSAEQNARLALNAEAYYRLMYQGGTNTWNLRDQHMTDTLAALAAHVGRHGRTARMVVWAHNSHLGDARATEMGERGEHNVGQLMRERFGDAVLNIGFTTYDGTVSAASDWDGPVFRKHVRPARSDSVEGLFHQLDTRCFVLRLRDAPEAARQFDEPLLERAIGVIYRPETERQSHYFESRLSEQFDAVIHVDRSQALIPLEKSPEWERGEPPELFPSGF